MTAAAVAACLLAAVVCSLPGRPRTDPPPLPRRAAGPRLSAGTAKAAVGAATALACLALFGLVRGLAVAAVAGPAAVFAVARLPERPSGSAPDRSVALVLDLTAAALRSGRPLADALVLAAPAGRPDVADQLVRVATLSRLGADAGAAWAVVPRDGPLGEVAAAAVRSATSGMRLAGAFERLAGEIRAERGARAAVRAHRAGVLAMAPLAACFLPSFVCLGVIPVVVGVARGALTGVP